MLSFFEFSIMSGAFRASSIRRGSKFCTIWRYWRVQISILKPDSASNHVEHIFEKCMRLLGPGPCWVQAWAGLSQPTPVALFLQPPPAATLFSCFCPAVFRWFYLTFWGTSWIKSPPRDPSFYLSVSWKYQNKFKEKLVSAMILIRINWESHFGVILFGKFQEILK